MVLFLASVALGNSVQGQFGGYIKTSCLNTYMYSFHIRNPYYCYVLWNPESQSYSIHSNTLPHKFSKQRFKSACPKLQAYVNKAKATGRHGRSWKLQRGADWKGIAQLKWGSVRTFNVMFLSGFVGFGKAGY